MCSNVMYLVSWNILLFINDNGSRINGYFVFNIFDSNDIYSMYLILGVFQVPNVKARLVPTTVVQFLGWIRYAFHHISRQVQVNINSLNRVHFMQLGKSAYFHLYQHVQTAKSLVLFIIIIYVMRASNLTNTSKQRVFREFQPSCHFKCR